MSVSYVSVAESDQIGRSPVTTSSNWSGRDVFEVAVMAPFAFVNVLGQLFQAVIIGATLLVAGTAALTVAITSSWQNALITFVAICVCSAVAYLLYDELRDRP